MIVSGIKLSYSLLRASSAARLVRDAVAPWKTARKYPDASSGKPSGIIACDANVPTGEKFFVQEG
jgi:hypothetical protein